jgi:hypothetical protein
MGKKTPGEEPTQKTSQNGSESQIDTRGTKVLGKDQQVQKEKKVDNKEIAPNPEKISSTDAIEKMLNGEVDAEDTQPGKEKETKAKTTEKDGENGEVAAEKDGQTKLNSQQDKGTEKEKYKWGELKGKAEKYDELEPKYRELEEKLKAAESNSKVKDWEELQKKYEETSAKLAAFDVQESEEFKEHVIKPIDERYGLLEGLAKEYKLDMEAIEKALSLTEKVARNRAIAKILAESEEPIDSVSQADAARAASEIFEIRSYGSELQKNAKQALEAMKLEREKGENAKTAESMKKFSEMAKVTQERMQKAIPFLKENPAEAKAIFDSLKPEDVKNVPDALQWYNAYSGLAMTKMIPAHKAQLAAKDSRISELEARIAELTNGGPSITGDQPRSENNNSPTVDRNDHRGFADRLMAPSSWR